MRNYSIDHIESEPIHHCKAEIYIAIFVSFNAILQMILDIVFEIIKLVDVGLRINHLSLTFLNAFISYKTLSAIHQDKFRFLHEDVQIFWILELLLILGDVFFIFDNKEVNKNFVYSRLLFIGFSIFNVIYITFIILKYKLYHITYQGN